MSRHQAAKQGPLLHQTILLLMQQGACYSRFKPRSSDSSHLQHRRAPAQGPLHLTTATANSGAHLDLLGRLLGALAACIPFSSQALQRQVLGSDLLLAAPDFSAALLYLSGLQNGNGDVPGSLAHSRHA